MSQSAPAPHIPAFSPRVMVLLAVIAALAVAALAGLGTFREELGGGTGDDGSANAYSRSAVGYAGLVELINESGGSAVISRRESRTPPGGLLILAPRPKEKLAKAVTDISFVGPRVVVLQKWSTAAQRRRDTWVNKVRLLNGAERDQMLSDLTPGAKLRITSGRASHRLTGAPGGPLEGVSFETGPIESWRSFEPGPGMRPILLDESGKVVLGAQDTDTPYLVLSDPDLLANHGLKDLQGANAAMALIAALDPSGQPVLFDVTLNGLAIADRGLAKALLTPPLLPATLCLVLAAILMAAHAFGRFGPALVPGRVFAFGKQALADNAAAMIRLARRERGMSASYVALTRDLALEAAGAPREMPPEQTDAFLDRLGVTRGVEEPWTTLKAQALESANADDLFRAAKKLFAWRLEMTRERR